MRVLNLALVAAVAISIATVVERPAAGGPDECCVLAHTMPPEGCSPTGCQSWIPACTGSGWTRTVPGSCRPDPGDCDAGGEGGCNEATLEIQHMICYPLSCGGGTWCCSWVVSGQYPNEFVQECDCEFSTICD